MYRRGMASSEDILCSELPDVVVGIGTNKDLQKSKEYRDILAAKDDPDSQYWVASYLENRARTKADFDDAHAWYVRAMNNGSEKAKNRLDTSDIKDVPEN